MGTKKSKRVVKEEKIIENVSAAIQGTMNSGNNNNNSASGVLAAALEKLTVVITTSIQSWQEGHAYNNADPDLRRKYDNLILLQKISPMEKSMNSTQPSSDAYSTPLELNRRQITPAPDNGSTPPCMAVRPPTPSNNNNDTASVAIVTTTSHPSEVLQAPIESNSNNNSSATNIALASHASTTSTTTIASIGTDSSMEVGPSRTASRGGASRWRPSLYSFGMHCNQCAINNNMEESQRIVYEEGYKDSLLS
jgi:hypothetical protein